MTDQTLPLSFTDFFKPSFFDIYVEDGEIFIEILLASHRYWEGKNFNYRDNPLETLTTLCRQLCGNEAEFFVEGSESYKARSQSGNCDWISLWSNYIEWQYFSVKGEGRVVHFLNAKEVINLQIDSDFYY